ncbi:hypothetical protein CR513_49821, partial [Mucuna pruriens]
MSTNNFSVHKEKTSLPPRRGQIKAQIFSSFAKKIVASIFSKDEKDKADNNGGGSATTTPPPISFVIFLPVLHT